MGAEGQVEVDQHPTRCLDISLHLAKDGHIGVSKAVNGLFTVADDEEINRFSIFKC